ncbi:MAG: maleylpyruvate isomerase N-terminal domain-containing protein [Actinomycetota bacterium]|nr:maleylpyruvate isomerase N-terminal domain-containing protein [Actinomycetota bacterium]
MDRRSRLVRQEDEGYEALCSLLGGLSAEDLAEPGLTTEWSVKDLLAHLGCWMAEAAHVLERIGLGTWEETRIDVDARNRDFYDACRDLDSRAVKCELWSARAMMLHAWGALPEITPAAEEWFVESGPAHYREHLPDLERFVRSRTGQT